jgi:hypothetical protein
LVGGSLFDGSFSCSRLYDLEIEKLSTGDEMALKGARSWGRAKVTVAKATMVARVNCILKGGVLLKAYLEDWIV